jgi:hypothetical protein
MVSTFKGGETVLTGLLADQSAVFGVVAQIEALGLELLELREIRARPVSRESADGPRSRFISDARRLNRDERDDLSR